MAVSGAKTIRGRVHEALEPDGRRRGFSLTTAVLVALVLLSFAMMALETEATRADTTMPPGSAALISNVNTVIVILFAIEYVVRLWAAGENPRFSGLGGRLRYMTTPLALADLAAFLPELVLTLFVADASGSTLAALRALRLFRLFKLARYVPAFGIVGAAVRRAGPPLLASLAVAAAQVFVAALILYFVEGIQPNPEHPEPAERFGSVIRAMWWSVVTLTTVGYGDVYPVTALGRFAAALVAIAGIGIVALPTGILASSFAEEFRERHEARQKEIEALERLDPGSKNDGVT